MGYLLSNLQLRSWSTYKIKPVPCELQSFQYIRYLGILNCWFCKEEIIYVSQTRKKSNVFWMFFWTYLNFFLIGLNIKCPKNKFLGIYFCLLWNRKRCIVMIIKKFMFTFQSIFLHIFYKFRIWFSCTSISI